MSTGRSGGLRAVVDTNVLVSAYTHPKGHVAPVWDAALERRYQLLTSPPIVNEVGGVLREKFAWEEKRIIRQLKILVRVGQIIVPTITLAVIPEDPPDDRILECAVEGRADLIVSGDGHLQDLEKYEGIPIVRPVDFLRTLGVAIPPRPRKKPKP
jgi:uncharacterized protein